MSVLHSPDLQPLAHRRARCGLGGASVVPVVTQQMASCCIQQGLQVPRSTHDPWRCQQTSRCRPGWPRRSVGTVTMAAGGSSALCSQASSALPHSSPRRVLACPTREAEARVAKKTTVAIRAGLQTPDPNCQGIGPLCCPGLCGRVRGPGLPKELPALSTLVVLNCLGTINVLRSLLFVIKWQRWPEIPLFKKKKYVT